MCTNGTFDNPKKLAINAYDAEIGGSFFLSNGFQATGEVSLSGASIGGNLDCENGTFVNPEGTALNAQGSEIKGYIFLRNSFQAKGEVYLYGATIGGNLDCEHGNFDNSEGIALSANAAEIKGDVKLSNDFKAMGTVSFVNTIIDDVLRLEKVRDSHEMILDLRSARIRTLNHQQASWPEKNNLFLDGLVYEKIIIDKSQIDSEKQSKSNKYLNWLRLQPNNENTVFLPQPYEQLAQVLQASGHELSATEVLIGKQDDRRKYGKLRGFSYFWNRLLGITIAHGYKSHRALGFALIFVLLGTFLFSWGYSDSFSKSLITPSDIESFESSDSSQAEEVSDDYPKFNSLIYSLDVFIPIMDLHQHSYWLPNANRGRDIPLLVWKFKCGELLKYYFWIHIVCGWILTSLWVAGFTGLVRSIE